MAGVGAAGALGSAALESNAAGNAADVQANAANKAATMQADLGQEGLNYENYQYQQDRADQMPFMQTGANSLATLGYLLGVNPGGTAGGGTAQPGQTLSIPGATGTVNVPGVTPLTGVANTNLGAMGSLMQAYPGGPFTAPTAEQARETPGYQFALDQGEKAVQAGASANGSLLTGGTLNAEQQFGQNLADTNYNNVYNRALQTYGTNYNTFQNDQANKFNRLAAIAGMGQTSAQQLGTAGMQSAGQVASTLTNTGQEVGQNMNNAAAATASGYMGQANAWGQGISGAANNLSQLAMLNKLLNGGGGSTMANPYANANQWNQVPMQYNDPTDGMMMEG